MNFSTVVPTEELQADLQRHIASLPSPTDYYNERALQEHIAGLRSPSVLMAQRENRRLNGGDMTTAGDTASTDDMAQLQEHIASLGPIAGVGITPQQGPDMGQIGSSQQSDTVQIPTMYGGTTATDQLEAAKANAAANRAELDSRFNAMLSHDNPQTRANAAANVEEIKRQMAALPTPGEAYTAGVARLSGIATEAMQPDVSGKFQFPLVKAVTDVVQGVQNQGYGPYMQGVEQRQNERAARGEAYVPVDPLAFGAPRMGLTVENAAGKLLPEAKAVVKRFYHGTGSAFETPDAAKFDPNGLYGPGYYVTSSPEVASGYAGKVNSLPDIHYLKKLRSDIENMISRWKQPEAVEIYGPQKVASEIADFTDRLKRLENNIKLAENPRPNVRAVSVPDNLRLLDVEGPVSRGTIDYIPDIASRRFGSDVGRLVRSELSKYPEATGDQVYQALRDAFGIRGGDGQITINSVLRESGYDGIQYAGGKRVPLRDAAGQPIEHQALVIFPESLPKIKNAISGLPLGTPPEVGGAVVGGVAGGLQGDENTTPQERARNALLMATGGGLLGHGLRTGRTPGGTIEDASKYMDAASKRLSEIGMRLDEITPKLEEAAAADMERFARRETGGTIQRPPNAGSLQNNQLEQIAREHGLNPNQSHWWDGLDPEALKEIGPGQRSGKYVPPVGEASDQIKRLNQEYMALTKEQENLTANLDANYQKALERQPRTPVWQGKTGAEPPLRGGPPEPPKPPIQETVPPPPPEKPGFAGNIRLSKFPEDLQSQIKATYDADPQKFEAARRGVRSDEQVRADATALIDSVGGNGQKSVKGWKPGQAWNAEEVLALKETLASRTKSVLAAQQTLREGGDSTANLVRLQFALKEQSATQKAVAGVTAEAGRTLRVMRQTVSGAIESGDERALREILDRLGGRQTAEEMAAALGKIDLTDREAVFKFIRSSQPHPSYITELFYNSILSNPGTHFRNTIGNSLAAVITPLESATAAAIDLPLSAISRRPRQRFFGEVTAEAFAGGRAVPEGVRKALYVIKNGYGWDDVAKLEMRRPEAFTGKLGAVVNMPSRNLVAADAVFRSIHYSAALNAGAYRLASKAGLKGQARVDRIVELLSNPNKELLDYAGKMSRYRVYQQESGQLAQGLTKIQNINIGINGRNIQPARFALPFIPTPINLAKYGLERSPLGVLNPKLWTNIIKKDPEAADQLARWFVGSAITSVIVAYAADGKITGAAPESGVERDRFYREGKQPYSIRIGDRWVPYNMMEPLNQPLALASVAVGAINEGKDFRSVLGAAAGGVAKNVISQRYLSGVADLMNAMEDPERYTANIGERAAVSLGVPFSSLSRGIAQTIDPTIRRSEGIVEEFKGVLPGLSKQLLPRLNAFGEEQNRETSPLGPAMVTTAKNDPVNNELVRLDVNVGFVGDSIRGVPLNRDQQQEYQAMSGKLLKAVLERAIMEPQYQQFSDADKTELLERLNRRVKDMAAKNYLDQLVQKRLRERAGVK